MLAWLGVEFGLVADGAACALEQQIGAFTAGKFGLGAEVTCHVKFLVIDLLHAEMQEPRWMAVAVVLRNPQSGRLYQMRRRF